MDRDGTSIDYFGGGADSASGKNIFMRRILTWLAPSIFLGIFFFYPLSRILGRGLDPAVLLDGGTLRLTWDVFLFTLYQAALSTLLTLVIGIPGAYLFSHFTFPGKGWLRTLTAIPFILPTVVVAAGFNALLGPRGWVNLGLMGLFKLDQPPIAFLYSLGAILLAHVFYNTTIVLRIVGNAWGQLDPRLEQAARVLGANPARVLRTVTLPLLRPAILAAGLLVFLFDFTSFGVILLLGGPHFATLEVEIYIQSMQMLNLPVASLLSIIQLLCTLAFSIFYSRLVTHVSIPTAPRAAEERLHPARTARQRVFLAGMLSLLFIFFVAPLAALPLRSVTRLEAARGQRTSVQSGLTLDYYKELFINRRDSLFYVPPIDALRNSLTYAGMTVVLSLAMGFPAASALAKPGKLEKYIDPFLMLPLGASAVTLGLGYILAFNKPPLALLTWPWLVPLAHSTIALPFVIRNLQPALAAIPDKLREAASTLGATPLRVWWTVDWPIVSRATLSAAAFAFTISLGEFGATSLLVRPEYPTLPTAIYRFLSQPGGLNYGQALAMASILMLVCGVGIGLIEAVRLPGTGEF